MSLIQESQQEQLKDRFKELDGSVKLTVFTQEMECQYCEQTRQLMEDIAALSDKIAVEVYDFVSDSDEVQKYKIDKIPATVVEFEVPAGAVAGMTYARFRCTTDGAVPFTGQASDGEVEDYQVRIACVSDFDGNGSVNAADLSFLLSQWGVCAGCPADLNGNGWVNLADLSILVSQWGD